MEMDEPPATIGTSWGLPSRFDPPPNHKGRRWWCMNEPPSNSTLVLMPASASAPCCGGLSPPAFYLAPASVCIQTCRLPFFFLFSALLTQLGSHKITSVLQSICTAPVHGKMEEWKRSSPTDLGHTPVHYQLLPWPWWRPLSTKENQINHRHT